MFIEKKPFVLWEFEEESKKDKDMPSRYVKEQRCER